MNLINLEIKTCEGQPEGLKNNSKHGKKMKEIHEYV